MTKVDDPLPDVAFEKVTQKLTSQTNTHNTDDDPDSEIEWLRQRLKHGRSSCSTHYHATCTECATTKCLGKDGYTRYEHITQLCECASWTGTEHLVVPFDNFGQYFGFPNNHQ